MTEKQQIVHFANELDNLVNKFRVEYDMTFAAVVGVLYMKAHLLCEEASDLDEEQL